MENQLLSFSPIGLLTVLVISVPNVITLVKQFKIRGRISLSIVEFINLILVLTCAFFVVFPLKQTMFAFKNQFLYPLFIIISGLFLVAYALLWFYYLISPHKKLFIAILGMLPLIFLMSGLAYKYVPLIICSGLFIISTSILVYQILRTSHYNA